MAKPKTRTDVFAKALGEIIDIVESTIDSENMDPAVLTRAAKKIYKIANVASSEGNLSDLRDNTLHMIARLGLTSTMIRRGDPDPESDPIMSELGVIRDIAIHALRYNSYAAVKS